jgi:hypothetical protein
MGDPKIMREQLEHLLDVTQRPGVTVQVLPFELSGQVATGGGPFSLLRFSEPDLPDIVYLEQLTSALYLDKRVDVDHYAMVMDRLCAQVEPPDRTEATLMTIREEL